MTEYKMNWTEEVRINIDVSGALICRHHSQFHRLEGIC